MTLLSYLCPWASISVVDSVLLALEDGPRPQEDVVGKKISEFGRDVGGTSLFPAGSSIAGLSH